MEVQGLQLLDEDIELPHQPSDDCQWQESVVLGFADPEKQVGGFIRIGHQPNLELARSCFGVVSRDGLNYTRTGQDLPLRASDRTVDTFLADDFQSARFGRRTSTWQAADANVDLDITVKDAHGPCDFWDLTGIRSENSEVMAANHLQAGGTFEGTLRIGDQQREAISGFSYRDHSWGPRYMDNPNADMYACWWVVGSLGPDFTFGVGGGLLRSGIDNLFAYVMRDGQLDVPEIEDASVLMAFDGLSNRGAQIKLASRKFGKLVFDAEAFGNVWLEMGSKHFEMASPCSIRCGDLVGGGLINTILNPRNGTDRPTHIASGALDNGLYFSRNGVNLR